MSENIFGKDLAADALFKELSSLSVSPERLELATSTDSPVDRILGGGFGDVRRAILHPSDEISGPDSTRLCGGGCHVSVAVKSLKDLDRFDLARRKRMVVREIHLLSKVRHPNIVPFRGFHVDFEGSVAWLISDWEPLGNVLDFIRGRHVTMIERLQLLHDTAIALAYLHSLNPLICHGDIKAANVLVSHNYRALLCDFGLAHIVDDEGSENLEISNGFRGSVRWCSPELLQGKSPSPQSDLWAFGWLVWEVVTESTPFATLRTQPAIINAIVHRHLPQAGRQASFQRVPQLRKLMRSCWHEDPTARPSAQTSSFVIAKIMKTNGSRAITKFLRSWISRAFSFLSRSRGEHNPHNIDYLSRTVVFKSRRSDASNAQAQDECQIPDARRPLNGAGAAPRGYWPKADESRQWTDPQEASGAPLDVNAVRKYFTQDLVGVGAIRAIERDLQILNSMDYTRRLENPTRVAQGDSSYVMKGQILGTLIYVAIKALRSVNMVPGDSDYVDTTHDRLRKRVARELLRWFDLRHPNILPLTGFAFLGETPCLLSMWCENGNVTQHLARNPFANKEKLVYQVGLGLAYLHSKGVIHADMKPVNILVNNDGDAMICDFGACKRPEMGTTGLTTANIAMHTVQFSPPEIFLDEPHTQQSDVYSFACVMLEILTGKPPFWYLRNAAEIVAYVSKGEMPSHSEYEQLPHGNWTLMELCWATDPAKRPFVAEVVKALEKMGFGSIRRPIT